MNQIKINQNNLVIDMLSYFLTYIFRLSRYNILGDNCGTYEIKKNT